MKHLERSYSTLCCSVSDISLIANKIRSLALVRGRGTVGLKGSTTDSKWRTSKLFTYRDHREDGQR